MSNLLVNIRNPILVGSLLSTMFLMLSCLNVIHIADSTINTIVNSIMSIISILGGLNAPHKQTNYIKSDSNNNIDIKS